MTERRDDKGEWKGALDRLFVEEVGGECAREEAAEAVALFRRIAADDEARARFDRLAQADRGLRGDLDTPGGFERGFGEAAFLGALDELLDAEAGPGQKHGQKHGQEQGQKEIDLRGNAAEAQGADVVSLEARRRTRVLGTIAALAAGVALAAGAWQLSRVSEGPLQGRGEEFQARSAVTPGGPEAGKPGGLRVDVFCVERDGAGELSFTGPEQAPFGVVRCGLDDEIKIAVVGAPDDRRFAHVVGVADDGTLYWYGPSPADGQALEVSARPGVEPVPVGESIRLEVNHRPGPVRVHVVMARAPMDHEAFAAFVGARRAGATRATLDVAGTGFAAASRVFEVVEENR